MASSVSSTVPLRDLKSLTSPRSGRITPRTWFLLHRIRGAFKSEHPIKMTSPVELDESYSGGLEKNKHKDRKLNAGRGTVGKTAVVGVKDRKAKEVRAEVIPDTTVETLQGFAAGNVKPRAYTDENSSCEGLPTHQTVSHSTGEYVRTQAHIQRNGILLVHHEEPHFRGFGLCFARPGGGGRGRPLLPAG